MVSIEAVQVVVAEWMRWQKCGQPTWKWYPDSETVDMGAAFQTFSLSPDQSSELTALIKAQFPEIESADFQRGFLNLRFSRTAWDGCVREWAEDVAAWFAFLQLPMDLNQKLQRWPYRWLLTLHEVNVLVDLPGWEGHAGYVPLPEEVAMVKQLLALPAILQQKGELPRKRSDIMQALVQIIQQLWKQPILTPTDLPGSAFRQRLLNLVIHFAEAVGKPLSQSPKDAIGLVI